MVTDSWMELCMLYFLGEVLGAVIVMLNLLNLLICFCSVRSGLNLVDLGVEICGGGTGFFMCLSLIKLARDSINGGSTNKYVFIIKNRFTIVNAIFIPFVNEMRDGFLFLRDCIFSENIPHRSIRDIHNT